MQPSEYGTSYTTNRYSFLTFHYQILPLQEWQGRLIHILTKITFETYSRIFSTLDTEGKDELRDKI